MYKKQRRITCLADFKDGVLVEQCDLDDNEQLTLTEQIQCELDSDDDEDEADGDREGRVGIRRVVDNGVNSTDSVTECTITNCINVTTSNNCRCFWCVFLCLLLSGCIIAMVVVIAQVVLPYMMTRSYQTSLCSPIELIIEDGKSCMCGIGCNAKYRCLVIVVSYTDYKQTTHNATVYENEATLGEEVRLYSSQLIYSKLRK